MASKNGATPCPVAQTSKTPHLVGHDVLDHTLYGVDRTHATVAVSPTVARAFSPSICA